MESETISMDWWSHVYDATSVDEKPTPGYLFKEICTGTQSCPEAVPDLAEYLMKCASGKNPTVALKATLCIRHLAEDVREFQRFMRRCPDALQLLASAAEPPRLAISQSIERQDAWIAREAAARALRAIIQDNGQKAQQAARVRAKCEGFGNYMPPPEDQRPKGIVDKMAGFVGDALADTVDDFREKGAVGAVRDGILDSVDIIRDGVGSVWGFLGGRKEREKVEAQQRAEIQQQRICKPMARDVVSQFEAVLMRAEAQMQAEMAAHAAAQASATNPAAYPGSKPSEPPATVPAPMPEPEDLLTFDDCPDGASGESAAHQLKNQGNDFVKAKKYQDAVKAYEAALAAAGGEDAVLAASLHSNLALCHLRLQLYRRAAEAASKSLELDTANGKAYYRRCLAHKALKMFEEARKDLEALQRCRHELSEAELARLRESLK
eukprot:TRINITY_DN23585_c0_g1_i1.p1 TRINITY_DN23585_c0_g1~~TRINITY_DN23585_c0_g1_i1.p1  ORF type:complete len:437 (-),score=116.82 TRINITY_DN23585_c0_g1_i1:83-1393(-)